MMTTKLPAVLLLSLGLAVTSAAAPAAGPAAPRPDLPLSPGLLELLRAEMREIAGGAQGIAVALATADWQAIHDTSDRIRASYIMEKKLTVAQAQELEQTLPARFKQLDAEFHQRAERLGAAALARDPELVAFRFSRLIESCAVCHAAYAQSRFPGFAPAAEPGHHH